MPSSTIQLKNPHAVLAVLKHRPTDVLDISFQTNNPTDAWKKVASVANQHGISVGMQAPQKNRGRRGQNDRGHKSERVGIAVATVREKPPVSLDEILHDPEDGQLWLALDCLQDPHNVGAVFRTAAFFGVRGIVMTRDKSAPLNGTVYDVAAGGVETVAVAMEVNLSRAIDEAKKKNVWVLGSSEHAEAELSEVVSDRPWMVVIGNEEKGMRRLTTEKCDTVCKITPRGSVTSLNVSVAAGILISHLAAPPSTAR